MSENYNLKDIVTKYITKIESLFPNMKASVLRIKNNRIENLASPSLPIEYISNRCHWAFKSYRGITIAKR